MLLQTNLFPGRTWVGESVSLSPSLFMCFHLSLSFTGVGWVERVCCAALYVCDCRAESVTAALSRALALPPHYNVRSSWPRLLLASSLTRPGLEFVCVWDLRLCSPTFAGRLRCGEKGLAQQFIEDHWRVRGWRAKSMMTSTIRRGQSKRRSTSSAPFRTLVCSCETRCLVSRRLICRKAGRHFTIGPITFGGRRPRGKGGPSPKWRLSLVNPSLSSMTTRLASPPRLLATTEFF